MAASPDLRILHDVLAESSTSLQAIYTALDGLKSRTSTTAQDWGSSTIADAMSDFSGDWDSHRHGMMGSIETIKKLVDETLQGFDQTESQLAHSLNTDTRSGTIGGAQ